MRKQQPAKSLCGRPVNAEEVILNAVLKPNAKRSYSGNQGN
jgi:hypothetical protein